MGCVALEASGEDRRIGHKKCGIQISALKSAQLSCPNKAQIEL